MIQDCFEVHYRQCPMGKPLELRSIQVGASRITFWCHQPDIRAEAELCQCSLPEKASVPSLAVQLCACNWWVARSGNDWIHNDGTVCAGPACKHEMLPPPVPKPEHCGGTSGKPRWKSHVEILWREHRGWHTFKAACPTGGDHFKCDPCPGCPDCRPDQFPSEKPLSEVAWRRRLAIPPTRDTPEPVSSPATVPPFGKIVLLGPRYGL